MSIRDSVNKESKEDAKAALSNALPPPLIEYLQAFTNDRRSTRKVVCTDQLKKIANDDVIDIMIPIATTGELNLGYIQPTALGSMFRSPSICWMSEGVRLKTESQSDLCMHL